MNLPSELWDGKVVAGPNGYHMPYPRSRSQSWQVNNETD